MNMRIHRIALAVVTLGAAMLCAAPGVHATAGLAEWEVATPGGHRISHIDPLKEHYGTCLRRADAQEELAEEQSDGTAWFGFRANRQRLSPEHLWILIYEVSMSTTKQTWDPNRYARNARFVSDLGMPVVELLAPQPGERILDLGCGDGALTEKIAALGCTVVGVDGSPEQVEAARQRGLEVYVRDGQQLAFDQEFDAVFSNAALHWMKQADYVIKGVWRALEPNGRFA